MFKNVQTVILDEGDTLMDMGFRSEIERIFGYLPGNLQTLLFSATMPPSLKQIVSKYIKEDCKTIDCIQEEIGASHTNIKVDQSHVVLDDPSDLTHYVKTAIEMAIAAQSNKHKIIVFFNNTGLVKAMYRYFQDDNMFKRSNVYQLHAKMQQKSRTNTSNRFRKSKRGVLFTTNVSARGVDYPDVTHVIQCGDPGGREEYIHRLGRTGRKGKSGNGVLILNEFEADSILNLIKDQNCPINEDLIESVKSNSHPTENEDHEDSFLRLVYDGDTIREMYVGMLGHYSNHQTRLKASTDDIIQTAKGVLLGFGIDEPPYISDNLLKKMGLGGKKLKHRGRRENLSFRRRHQNNWRGRDSFNSYQGHRDRFQNDRNSHRHDYYDDDRNYGRYEGGTPKRRGYRPPFETYENDAYDNRPPFKQRQSNIRKPRDTRRRSNNTESVQCYTCGEFGHMAAQCPKTICRKCGEAGHIQRSCPN